jgi:hypothetical protein
MGKVLTFTKLLECITNSVTRHGIFMFWLRHSIGEFNNDVKCLLTICHLWSQNRHRIVTTE